MGEWVTLQSSQVSSTNWAIGNSLAQALCVDDLRIIRPAPLAVSDVW